MSALQDRLSRINRAIWAPRLAHLPVWKMHAVRFIRLVLVLLRDVVDGPLTLWTMSLVYTTLLSMVPMLALSVTVLKAFGVHGRVELLLQTLLAPLGAQGQEITSRIIGFIQNTNVGVLGSVGLALLIYTVISLMQKIEESFNSIWHVTQSRSLGTRFSRYLSALLVGPLLLFTAFGVTTVALDSQRREVHRSRSSLLAALCFMPAGWSLMSSSLAPLRPSTCSFPMRGCALVPPC